MVLPPYYLEVILSVGVACIATMVIYRGGSIRHSLNFFPKVLEVSLMCSSSHGRSPHWNQYMVPLLFSMASFSLEKTGRF